MIFSIYGIVAIADDAVSPVFTFDARYQPCGLTPGAWVAYEAEGLSLRFSAATVERAADENGNGIPDSWEATYGLVGANVAADADPDGDGRTNIDEYNAGTNPVIADDWNKSIAELDKSFVCDTHVEYVGGNPSFDETFAIIRVSNGFVCDTGGLYYDWDGDGIPNWWESRYSRDGGKTGLVASRDDDHDGMSNYAEFIAYTDPTNNASRFVIGLTQIAVVPTRSSSVKANILETILLLAKSVETNNETFALQWQSAKGRTYSVFSTDSLATGWRDEPDAEIPGTGDVMKYIPSENGTVMFFKVKVRLADDY